MKVEVNVLTTLTALKEVVSDKVDAAPIEESVEGVVGEISFEVMEESCINPVEIVPPHL